MKRIACVQLLLCVCLIANAQTPVNMSAQPNYTYTENFADIANWVFNTSTSPGDGTFVAGIGASAWKGYEPTGTGTIPNGTKITSSTTFFQTVSGPGSSAGIYKQTQAIGLISTGTSDNTTSVAVDFFVNYSSLNAGTLSFDWASVNNSTGDRKGSVRVYTSTDGVTFTELTGAAVLNFTNNTPTSGSISFVQLPASFNNNANARIRFYYYNGIGGTSGSRPKFQLDNVKVTGVPASVCSAPTAQPSNLNLTPAYSSTSGSFTAASPVADGYLVIASLNSSLTSMPVNGTSYAEGASVGDGTVVSIGSATSFSATSLSPATTYYYFIFSVNYLCSGGPIYNLTSPLFGNATTLSGSSPCTAPAAQATNLVLSNITSTSIKGTFTASASVNADRYLIVRSTSATLSSGPVNGSQYSANSSLGGGIVVTKTPLNTFTANGLTSGIKYYFFVFADNEDNCTSGPVYNSVAPLTANATTVGVPACTTPAAQPTSLQITATNNSVNAYFTQAANVDGYIVLYSTSSSLSLVPQNGVTYSNGTTIGNATVLSNSTATSFTANNLTPSTTYYFFIFSKKDQCSGGPLYLTTAPLQGNITTAASALYGYYFGNLHSHTAYSDGNQDHPTYTPADDYTFAKSSQCMDFLGISEHNHSEAGMTVSKWAPGIAQANAATTSNFLALYGMEWGVISNGGHVLVYGIDQLLGWEAGNYNIFVAKNDYTGKPPTTGTTGLFKTINDWPSTAFAMLAHPSSSDFNNIAATSFSPTADSAVAGCAVESGPAFSTTTNYTDFASRLGYYTYYKKLLAKGYHVGPNIDHDNHNTTYGRTNYSRLAVLSPTLTKTDLLLSIKNRHFYATHDCDTKASFTLNNQQMGSIISGSTPPAISIYVFDPTRPSAVPNIKLMYGVPGSQISAIVLDSVNGNTFNYTDYSMPDGTGYYFAEITINGDYVITSPVWYTKSSSVNPVTLLSFKATLTPEKTVALDWRTVNEVNNKAFVVERSGDGVAFSFMDSVAGKNLTENTYSSLDKSPLQGWNYYRLKQLDFDGKFSYSNIVAVKMGSTVKNDIQVYPNPVKDVLRLELSYTENQKGTITILDEFGRKVRSINDNFIKGSNVKSINLTQLNSGTYYVLITTDTDKLVRRFIKL